ncbi:winged helix-turn-helix domain-containing protein [Leptospira santarosai]|nr:winged helix-turn-helix domain-containing protein [Leptospira santarosai]MDI7216093.1 winged helix-turn-helix domain-containing protein [Leptospira santarosai]
MEGVRWNGVSGRPPKLTLEQKKDLKRIVLKGATNYGYTNELWSTSRISEIIKKEFGVKFHRDYVGVLLHELGFSYQKPKRRTLERDESSIKTWKTET